MDTNEVFGLGNLTCPLASRFLGMWCQGIWMAGNVIMSMFGLIMNLIRFSEIWDPRVWFILRNPIGVIYSF